MEQTINVSGKQYKISSDVEISTLQMTEVIKQIEKMSCNNCGGNIKTLSKKCPTVGKKAGDTISMSLVVSVGTTPYKTIKFYKKAANDVSKIEITPNTCSKANVGAGTYTCSYTIAAADTFPIEVSSEVIDANDQTCTELCSIAQIAVPSCDFTVT